MSALVLLDASPCDHCRFAPRCGDELLACDAFVIFAAGGSMARWQHAPRAPSAAKFAVVFGSSDKSGIAVHTSIVCTQQR